MTTLLQLTSSLAAENGQSSRLVADFTAGYLAQAPGTPVLRRDLARDPLPHLDAARFGAFTTAADRRSPEQRAWVAESDRLIDELREADRIVLGLPMYNFAVPSTLKAYFDHIARAGVTFRYTTEGPEGLLHGKRAYVLAARGGKYAGTAADTQTPYVTQFLGFLGIDDVRFVYAEGLALGDAAAAEALQSARQVMNDLLRREFETPAVAAIG